jgi:hypothetical protein
MSSYFLGSKFSSKNPKMRSEFRNFVKISRNSFKILKSSGQPFERSTAAILKKVKNETKIKAVFAPAGARPAVVAAPAAWGRPRLPPVAAGLAGAELRPALQQPSSRRRV